MSLVGRNAERFQTALEQYEGNELKIEDKKYQNETSPRFWFKVGEVIIFTTYTQGIKDSAVPPSPSRMAVGFDGDLEKILKAGEKLEELFDVKLRFMEEYSNADTI